MARLQPERPTWQRDACAGAVVDRKMGPKEVARQAAAGELTPEHGPFEVSPATVSSWASKLRKRRAGQLAADGDRLPAAVAIGDLRRRLLRAVEHELARLEREQRRKGAGPADAGRMRELARALREAAAIPDSGTGAVKPGQRDPATGEHVGARTRTDRGSIAGVILRDASTATDPPQSTSPSASAEETRDDHGRPSDALEHGSDAGEEEPGRDDEPDDVHRSPVLAARERVDAALGALGQDAARIG